MEEQKEISENKAKEVTVLKRNLRFLKRLILGKKKPPFFLRMLCVLNLAWGTLMVIYYSVLALVVKLKSGVLNGGYFNDIYSLGVKLFLVMIFLHLVALIGVVLMYRQKKTGFYIYTFAALMMPIYMLTNSTFSEILIMLISSVLMILLFALNYKSLGLKFRKDNSSETEEL